MNWTDKGILLSKNKFQENSTIVNFYTKNHGKCSGIIFGASSKKIKNYLQIGNELFLNYNLKSLNNMGHFKIEIFNVRSPNFFDDFQKLNCITSVMNLLKLLTAEAQKNISIYNLIEKFYVIISYQNWLQNYIYWELELYKILGYDLDFKSIINKKIIDNKTHYVAESSSEKKIVPNFLIDKQENVTDMKTLLNGLKIIGDFLDKTILRPNNISSPISRYHFISSLK